MPGLIPTRTERQDDDPFSGGDTEGVFIAIPVPWALCLSGCVEWRLIDWTLPDDDGQRLPVWRDPTGATGAWADDYALRGPRNGDWHFPDGERCNDAALAAAFRRRRTRH